MPEIQDEPSSSGFELLALSPFSQLIGPIEVRWDPVPVFEATVRDDCANSMGKAHGGFLASLIDITTGQGVKRILDDNRSLVTATANIEYLAGTRVGDRLRLEISVEQNAESLVLARCQVAVGPKYVAVASISFSARRT